MKIGDNEFSAFSLMNGDMASMDTMYHNVLNLEKKMEQSKIDRFKTRIDAQDSASDMQRKFNFLFKIEQQLLGRMDVYRQMENEGIDDAIIRRIKDKFNY